MEECGGSNLLVKRPLGERRLAKHIYMRTVIYPVIFSSKIVLFVLMFLSCFALCSQAWSSIVYQLIPNVKQLEETLATFTNIIDASEVLLFEKATFLVSFSSLFFPDIAIISAVVQCSKIQGTAILVSRCFCPPDLYIPSADPHAKMIVFPKVWIKSTPIKALIVLRNFEHGMSVLNSITVCL